MSNQRIADEVLDALGDPMRRRILETLRNGSLPVGELASALPIGRPAVSRHLKVLTRAGLVVHTTVGTRNNYSVAPRGRAELEEWLNFVWGLALQSFADYVDKEKSS
jgi:DNA-binding transcriptional ArsR family regulator